MPTEPDVEQPIIVDGDLIEAAKENIQPLASGRRATTLSTVLSTPHAQRESKLAAVRNRLRINVEISLENDDDNALEAYCQLIYWTLENYPQGHSAESGLLELLEEATRILKDHRGGIWKTDLRYLKLWVLYANYVEKPTVIYRYLLANEIGTTFALLYEEFATVLERNGRRVDADEIYLLGINRQASPVERLQTKHREFQKRMMLATPLEAIPPTEQPQPEGVTVAQRKVLGESTSASKSSTRLARPTSTTMTTHSYAQDDVFGPGAGALPRPKPNGRMQVFMDPSGVSGRDAQAIGDAAVTPWNELGTRKERIKENVSKVSKFHQTTLRQPGRQQRTPATSTSRIPVFKDPVPGDLMPPPPAPKGKEEVKDVPVPGTPLFVPFIDDVSNCMLRRCEPYSQWEFQSDTPPISSGAQAPESVMKVKTIGARGQSSSSEAEALRKDPFKNYPDKPLETE
ncbi:Mad3/BUB1 homology region 1-domain-containing protein [Multifurca ochricompacta]|uniref:Mad3/BUB1 homology region 1-domain-containing protein n=1 Tax=Multifurca ochricompacta TaxID=376703 RepID=A0AAD4M5E0_9AGAM|nr:Mad3/BUB1 homology region 1-domain-containing protein [Multifurca ochricompacta]